MTANPMRLIAVLVTLTAVALTAALLVQLDGDAVGLVRRLRDLDQMPYAVAVAWVCLAPVLFVLGASYVQVSTGPWVVLAVVQLVAVVALSVHLRAEMSTGWWYAAAACGAACFVSVIAATAGRGARPGEF